MCRYKKKTDILEEKVKEDIDARNLKAGFEMFRYVGSSKAGSFWEMRYEYRPQRTMDPIAMTYGGYPMKSKLGLMKAYLENC